MSLYLKYRPQNLKSVVGQTPIVATLRGALSRGALTHAYLFSGPRGTGKTSFARILAKAINCLSLEEGIDPCDRCENCQAILAGRLVDLIEIDAASNRGIDEIRELKEKILFSPTQGKAKVYIIDEVHMLTKEAFNALLKTLEEPPSHAFFILATTEAHKIPETIVSRCQQFSFRRIPDEAVAERLKTIAETEGIQAEPEALSVIARHSNGGLRDAIGLLEQMTREGAVRAQDVVEHLGIVGHQLLDSFYRALAAQEARKAIALIGEVNDRGHSLSQFCREFLAYLREKMLEAVAEKKPTGDLIQWIDLFSEAKLLLGQASIPPLPLEIAALKACGFQAKIPTPAQAPSATLEPSAAPETPQALPSFDLIRQHWSRVAEAIKSPFLRLSFLDGEPLGIEKGNLQVAFRSHSLMEKVKSPLNQSEIQQAFQSVFNTRISLHLEVKKDLPPAPVSTPPPTSKNPADPLVAMAAEVFGN